MKMNLSSPLPDEQTAGFYETDMGQELREQSDNSVVELLGKTSPLTLQLHDLYISQM